MDELAEALKLDPFHFRLKHLNDEQGIQTLIRLKELVDKDRVNFPQEAGLGISFARYKNSAGYCSLAVLLRVNDDAEVELIKIFCVVDVGEVVDISGVRSQRQIINPMLDQSRRRKIINWLNVAVDATMHSQHWGRHRPWFGLL